MTKEDHEAPSNAELVADDPNDPYEDHGEYIVSHVSLRTGIDLELQTD